MAALAVAIGLALSIPAFAPGAALARQSESSPAMAQAGAAAPGAEPGPATGPSMPEDVHQARIKADTKKLYQLSLELRTEVGKTYKESLSLTVLKKAEELEKLAKVLKSEMNREAATQKQ